MLLAHGFRPRIRFDARWDCECPDHRTTTNFFAACEDSERSTAKLDMAYHVAEVHGASGESDPAFKWLEKAYSQWTWNRAHCAGAARAARPVRT